MKKCPLRQQASMFPPNGMGYSLYEIHFLGTPSVIVQVMSCSHMCCGIRLPALKTNASWSSRLQEKPSPLTQHPTELYGKHPPEPGNVISLFMDSFVFVNRKSCHPRLIHCARVARTLFMLRRILKFALDGGASVKGSRKHRTNAPSLIIQRLWNTFAPGVASFPIGSASICRMSERLRVPSGMPSVKISVHPQV
jgi:hypothetical protein